MNTNVNLLAPVGVLALLGTGFLLFVAALIVIQSLVVRRTGRAKIVILGMIVIAAAYLAAILIFSFASHEKVLARGEEKHFCEIDCHLAYSVADTRRAKTLGSSPNQTTAHGTYAIITIKTRFDEGTIGPGRGDGLLYPNSRTLTLIDDQGNRYGPSSQSGTPLTNPLRPGESYTTDLVFDLPADLKRATLLMKEGDWITHLVIGHENSPLHQKTAFQIDLPPPALSQFDRHSQKTPEARYEVFESNVNSELIESTGLDGPQPQADRVEACADEVYLAFDWRQSGKPERRRS
jgi:hypothetical protein